MGITLENKKILVTGGNGYLGSFLVKSLKSKGAEVFIVSKNVVETDYSFNVDLSNFENLNKIISEIQPDIVYHLAANISRERDFSIFEEMLNDNVLGTFNLIKALQNTNYQHFIFTSTSEIYGNNESPFHENQIPAPVSPYSLTKVMAENLIKTYHTQVQKNYTILRLFNFYGENMSESFFITQLINTLKRNEDFPMTLGDQSRDFLYIEDVISAMILSAENTNAQNETFNVCRGKGDKINELANSIAIKMGKLENLKLGALPYRNNEIWEMIGDASKIKESLGFVPKYSLFDGISKILSQ
jgi:UDP-glucose 4-epimerase